ncbi:hypothetical protein SLA2020_367450 [Shorea laevis]
MDSSSSSCSFSSSTSSSLHLAMAALVGASLMAISAFYIHKRSVDQVLQRLIDIRRKPSRSAGNGFVIMYREKSIRSMGYWSSKTSQEGVQIKE